MHPASGMNTLIYRAICVRDGGSRRPMFFRVGEESISYVTGVSSVHEKHVRKTVAWQRPGYPQRQPPCQNSRRAMLAQTR